MPEGIRKSTCYTVSCIYTLMHTHTHTRKHIYVHDGNIRTNKSTYMNNAYKNTYNEDCMFHSRYKSKASIINIFTRNYWRSVECKSIVFVPYGHVIMKRTTWNRKELVHLVMLLLKNLYFNLNAFKTLYLWTRIKYIIPDYWNRKLDTFTKKIMCSFMSLLKKIHFFSATPTSETYTVHCIAYRICNVYIIIMFHVEIIVWQYLKKLSWSEKSLGNKLNSTKITT